MQAPTVFPRTIAPLRGERSRRFSHFERTPLGLPPHIAERMTSLVDDADRLIAYSEGWASFSNTTGELQVDPRGLLAAQLTPSIDRQPSVAAGDVPPMYGICYRYRTYVFGDIRLYW